MSRKKKFDNRIKANNDGLRFATPEIIASYRAKRLKCRTIADISCGIGGQTIFFAKECEKVYAVEIDPKKIEFAKKNCERYDLENVEFICGDALSEEVIKHIPEVDILFSDPARPPSENERRVSSLEPGIPNVLSAYADKTKNFAFEAPPQMTPDRIQFNCEKEYISLNGQLNRLNLYFGDIKSCDRSAISLPTEARIDSTDIKVEIVATEDIGKFACEPEPSVIKAGLLPELAGSIMENTGSKIKLFKIDQKRILLTSDSPINHPIAKNSYEVLQIAELDTALINKYLRKEDIGTVILRAGIDPSKYWEMRNEIEEGLKGSGIIHLFVKDGTAIICKIIN